MRSNTRSRIASSSGSRRCRREASRSPASQFATLSPSTASRVTVEDGAWGLVRASSNKPELVVVVESPTSEAGMRAMFEAVDRILRENPEVGAYNQTI